MDARILFHSDLVLPINWNFARKSDGCDIDKIRAKREFLLLVSFSLSPCMSTTLDAHTHTLIFISCFNFILTCFV